MSSRAYMVFATSENHGFCDEGKKYVAEGSPEVQLFLAVHAEGSISKDELQKKLAPSVFKIGCSQAGKNKWVEMGKQVSRKEEMRCRGDGDRDDDCDQEINTVGDEIMVMRHQRLE
ncbi:unnamed protein product [Cochlearia groenlandica]